MAENNDFPKAFKLAKAGDSAAVRFLHTSTKTIETALTHWVQKGDTWKHFRCVGENCPACKAGNQVRDRMYIRVFNYSTNEVEVWDRTNNIKFFDMLSDVEKEWGGLNATAIKVTRDSDEFPTYSLSPLPPNKYPQADATVDEKIAYRMASRRSAEDIQTFLDTGVMPPKQPRTETNAKSTAEKKFNENIVSFDKSGNQTTKPTAPTSVSNDIDDEDLPF